MTVFELIGELVNYPADSNVEFRVNVGSISCEVEDILCGSCDNIIGQAEVTLKPNSWDVSESPDIEKINGRTTRIIINVE